jgi:predicted MFS family arabinose efflux permease
VLLGVELLDELYSGVPAVGAPAIQASFAVDYERMAWLLLLVPCIVGMAVEPLLYLLADRHPRKWFVCGGLLGMAGAGLLAAAATAPWQLCAAVTLAYVSAGIGVNMAQATLIDEAPERRAQVMARWAMLGTAGDLLAPAMMAGLAAVGLGWRAGYLIVGGVAGLFALALIRERFPAGHGHGDEETDEGGVRLRDALWTALRNRRLLLWLFCAGLCGLLDEILVIFASLHLRDVLGAGAVERSIVLGAFVAGGAIGLVICERLLARREPLRVLAASSAACALLYIAWIAAPSWPVSALLMAAVGCTAAPLYPIAAAQMYEALPGRSGAVHAAGHLFTPIEMALPWLLGWIADQAGTAAALLALTAQPIVLAAVAWASVRRARRGEPAT